MPGQFCYYSVYYSSKENWTINNNYSLFFPLYRLYIGGTFNAYTLYPGPAQQVFDWGAKGQRVNVSQLGGGVSGGMLPGKI